MTVHTKVTCKGCEQSINEGKMGSMTVDKEGGACRANAQKGSYVFEREKEAAWREWVNMTEISEGVKIGLRA